MNRQSPLVSIGIPTYNRAKDYLPVALESALAQDYPRIEIIVADNGSTDDTARYVDRLDDNRIRYYRHEKNLEPNDNFNFCLQQALGVYFLLLHDDDAIDSGFVTACISAAEGRSDIGVLRSGTRVIDGNGRFIRENENRVEGLSSYDFIRGWFTHQTALYLCSTLYNTELLRQIGGFRSPHNLFQDVFAIMHLALSHGRRDVKTVLASFRRHGGNRGDSVMVKQWSEDSLALLDQMCGLLPEHTADIAKLGMPFMCRLAYIKAANIQNHRLRYKTYLSVWHTFNFTLSPMKVIRQNDFRWIKKAIKFRIDELMNSTKRKK